MPSHPEQHTSGAGHEPEAIRTENDILKLKMMAEFGAQLGAGGEIPPELEQQFLQQVYAFEQNYASGASPTFAESVGRPALKAYDALADRSEAVVEALVQEALSFYADNNIQVHFEYDYPAETRYRFLMEELPGHANHFGKVPGMLVGVLYEEYHPNHSASIESGAENFMEGLRTMNVEKLKSCLSPVQYLPEGPYPTQVLLDALEEKFQAIERMDDFEYMILETSYDLNTPDEDQEDANGLGYAEGLVKFVVKKRNGEEKPIGGPFKFYFHYEYGIWSIMYFVFPGIRYPLREE